jgi:hypothetical protein
MCERNLAFGLRNLGIITQRISPELHLRVVPSIAGARILAHDILLFRKGEQPGNEPVGVASCSEKPLPRTEPRKGSGSLATAKLGAECDFFVQFW